MCLKFRVGDVLSKDILSKTILSNFRDVLSKSFRQNVSVIFETFCLISETFCLIHPIDCFSLFRPMKQNSVESLESTCISHDVQPLEHE